jgi:hypothetical protein
MKIVALVSSFVLFCISSTGYGQSRFTPDSISIEYAQCKGDTAKTTVRIINRGSSLEILDLRFADSNRTWEIYDTSGSTSFIKGLLLLAGDTAILNLRQKRILENLSRDWYRDTLVTSGAATSDTLLLNAKIQFADLKTDLQPLDLGIVVQGATASHSFKIWNNGDAPHIFDYTVSPGWMLEGLAVGDTLYPGDTIDVRLRLQSTDVIGTYSTSVWIHGDCDDLGIINGIKVKIVPAFAHWSIASFSDTATGCISPGDYELIIKNESTTNTIVDSIQILGQGQLWSIDDPADRSFIIAPSESRTITLTRGIGATSTRLVIHSSKNGNDTLPVVVTPLFSRPTIKNAIDTAFVQLKPSEQIAYSIEIQNLAAGSYRLSNVHIEGDPRWSILGLDTITTIGLSQSMLLKLVFSGAADPGDYPVKAFIRGVPCDTLLTQVIVARVAEPVSVEKAEPVALEVYPTVATTHLTIKATRPTRYALFDMLGNELLTGITEAIESKLDVKGFPGGRYFLRLELEEGTKTIAISVRR